jgi:hypothetical protein
MLILSEIMSVKYIGRWISLSTAITNFKNISYLKQLSKPAFYIFLDIE